MCIRSRARGLMQDVWTCIAREWESQGSSNKLEHAGRIVEQSLDQVSYDFQKVIRQKK